ncbi:MAG TPA: cohesin domain-containing protein [Candidatus Cloacimonadota bacterium]|nr:cohesin domain-containing protein [Candidatus Cloacimonadota bacterium]
MKTRLHGLILILAMIAISVRVHSVSISCSPNPQTAALSQAFTLAVNLDTPTQIRGYSIRIQYDPTILSLSSATCGTLFNGMNIFWWRNINEEPGIQRIECIVSGYNIYVTGPGNLINLTMTSLAQGYSPIDFLTVELYNPQGPIIPDVTFTQGAVLIGSNFLYAKAKYFLQGAYNNGSMKTEINTLLPFSSPYGNAPLTVTSIPADIVDWLLIELRASASGPVTHSQAVFLHADGSITSAGKPCILFTGITSQPYFLVVRHRNHLPVMSATAMTFASTGNPPLCNLSLQANVYGQGGIIAMGDGNFAAASGDANMDGNINNSDRNQHWRVQTGLSGYLSADFDLDGFVAPADLIRYWQANNGSSSTIPLSSGTRSGS